ncbi:MAG: acyl-CoA dehydratase activase [Bacillota bacterium]|nr:acyl-CoA dehydratase activase [Bacillota bacterium]
MRSKVYLGIDVGSVSTNVVASNISGEVLGTLYLKTQGQPILAIQQGIKEIHAFIPQDADIGGVGTTGSGRMLAAALVGADVVKNEITAHATATLRCVPGTRTILEIGGQDSKIIILNHGVVTDFAMNTVCAAGTGSFLDRQASRLGIPIEELGQLALKAKTPTRIAGRCAVFAESDMVHKQQVGHSTPDIVAGLCEALVRNYLNNVAKGKSIVGPIVFQGGVAANVGIRRAFEEALGLTVHVPEHYSVMGALGACYLAEQTKTASTFRGFDVAEADCQATGVSCTGCGNNCEVVQFSMNGDVVAFWGDRCGKYEHKRAVASN